MTSVDMSAGSKENRVFRARGITKIYQMGEVPVHALRGIDVDLYGGELTALLGWYLGPLPEDVSKEGNWGTYDRDHKK